MSPRRHETEPESEDMMTADSDRTRRDEAAELSAHHHVRNGVHTGLALAIREAGGEWEAAKVHDQAADYHFDAARSYRIATDLFDGGLPDSAESHMRSGAEWRHRAESWEARHHLATEPDPSAPEATSAPGSGPR
jgi:hypothetical protein